MPRVKKPREIINRKALVLELENVTKTNQYTSKHYIQILSLFKSVIDNGWAEANRRFEKENSSAIDTICSHSYLVDQIIRSIYDVASKTVFPSYNPTTGDQMAVLATGGYGRGELAPFSDIDIMFLLPYKLTARSEQIIEFTLYMLWDLGLKVGHATRSVNEALRLSKDDLVIRTSLLESRWLWGNFQLSLEFKERFRREVVLTTGPNFVRSKLAERDERHLRMGDTRYVLEPNVKEGKGALRDLQTLFWIAQYLYRAKKIDDLLTADIFTFEDIRRFKKAAKFLWTVRCHLHYHSGRPEERLSFDVQDEIGKRMRYRDSASSRGVERFMKHYFLIAKDVGDLTRTLCSVLENQQKKSQKLEWLLSFSGKKKTIEGFEIESGRVNIKNNGEFEKSPAHLLKLFHVAQSSNLDIHPNALRCVTQNLQLVNKSLRQNPEANEIFTKILLGRDPDCALTRLNESGVMGRFIPEFGRVVAQMQYDMYHVYTVDEHTIRAIGILNGIETKKLDSEHPLACLAIDKIESRRVLYFSVLLHDIAKGQGGDHSELGAEIAMKIGPRFGFSSMETQTLSWLVRFHLLMSGLAFKRDIEDPKTVSDFVSIVQSHEKLRLLFLLTVSDIRAVGPNVWNSWKAGLLTNLYLRAEKLLSGTSHDESQHARVEKVKLKLQSTLPNWSMHKIEKYFKNIQNRYWLEFDSGTLVRHAKLIDASEASKKGFKIDFYTDHKKEIMQVFVYAPDHPGLFASIAGAIALCDASIVDAKIQTLKNGMALDSFSIVNLHDLYKSTEVDYSRLKDRIRKAIQGEINLSKELLAARKNMTLNHARAFNISPGVLIDNNASQKHTVIEINGRDRIGFLYDVTAALTGGGFQISSAHISTYGERVVDVFYIRDVFGSKIESETKLANLRKILLDSILPENNRMKKKNTGEKKD